MRTLAQRRGLGISGVLLLLMALVLALTSTPAAGIVEPPGTIHVKTSTLSDHECDSSEWHFVINQINDEANAPASITVKFSGGATVVVGLDTFTGGVAHYATTQHLDQTVVDATAVIYLGWAGEFNLSHGPCMPGTTTTIASSTTAGGSTTTTTIGSSTTAGGSTTTNGSSTTAGGSTTTTIGSSTTAGGSTTTTTIGSSTTAGGSTTTTTIGSSTTAGGSTTTTTIGSSTTAGGSTTTTTQGATTSQGPTTPTTAGAITTQGTSSTTIGGASGSGPSSSTTVTVLGIQVSAPVVGQVTQATLPFTGLPATSMAFVAASLAVIGLLLLAGSRGLAEKNPSRSWD